MAKVQYSIHRCLTELKTIDKRITKTIMGGSYIGTRKLSTDKANMSTLTVAEYEEKIKSNLQSVEALIERARRIKAAVVYSNATTMVTIGGVEMTVSEAIERKNSIDYDKSLLRELKEAHKTAIQKIQKQNDALEEALERQLQVMTGGDKSKMNGDDILTFSTRYREQNQWEVIDPLKLQEVIERKELEISNFEMEVDYVLSTSNAVTTIDIEE